MDLWQAFVLSLIQGLTEFLPISSSGHLVITRDLLNWPEASVAFDAFTGLGTLSAVLLYFRRDLIQIFYHWCWQFRAHKVPDPEQYAKLGNQLIIATFPALLVGFLVKDHVDTLLHSPILIACTTIGFGILLGLADYYGKKIRILTQTTTTQALFYGLAQAIALIPGTSRSGITITAGLAMGFSREAAARFSFLLSIPISAAAGAYGLLKLLQSDSSFSWQVILLSYCTAFASAYFCISLFLRFLDTIGMWPHVVYRLFLGSLLLFVFL
ncbi:undecaprenyl-diphosphate phosphatase [Suttonella indologenes]|uniref:Undecaprenyl-diphosphatase n=1 Tax=Suttonella indologenes TaxID=13276 RepID=A0A380MIR9_9GAMM|nr:undecaprenyl-diphosphate phosphatase [Suttonella indologenes]SUO92197.1 Undecaprenyl-diphosphatase [Suttonella indologenes]